MQDLVIAEEPEALETLTNSHKGDDETMSSVAGRGNPGAALSKMNQGRSFDVAAAGCWERGRQVWGPPSETRLKRFPRSAGEWAWEEEDGASGGCTKGREVVAARIARGVAAVGGAGQRRGPPA
jgi:hypothetical protein